ncbi:MAG TPA: MBL fold metallo-hydrolase [Verrucomicrobiota bacterium]|nr:MBL fold metallo-hydrolase [Verrucomicrobiales bacterium]HRI15370.1 MBL fold metallo-hydrolase [Verrucomicrobiota bacterium]
MNLEDSLGDILRKARTSTQVPPEAAAQAAGLSSDDYSAFESTGIAPAALRFEPLGKLLTLGGSRLEELVRGWRPEPVDLSRWQRFEMVTTAGDDMTVNAYLAWDPTSRAAAIFDTGFEVSEFLKSIESNQLRLGDIFITHSHPDHVAGLGELRRRFPAARLHTGSPHAPTEHRLKPGETIALGNLRVAHRLTPGHADDGVTYVITGWAGEAPPVAIVGDAVFSGSMGGARDQLTLARTKVREEIFSLPEATLICPGHGPLTTVGQEIVHNPWFP